MTCLKVTLILLISIGITCSSHKKHTKREHNHPKTKHNHATKRQIKILHDHHHGHHQETHHENVARFIIPHHYANDETEDNVQLAPETIKIIKKSNPLKETELPGAFGEDEELEDLYDLNSGSGSGSGSGSSSLTPEPVHLKHHVTHDPIAENAGNFGNNVVPKAGINPTSAFLTSEENHDGFVGHDKTIEKTKKKKKKPKKKGKSEKKSVTTAKIKETAHKKDKDIMKQVKNIAKQIHTVEKKDDKKTKKKNKKDKNQKLKVKVSTYIKKLEENIRKEIKDKHIEKSQSENTNKDIVTSNKTENEGGSVIEDATDKSVLLSSNSQAGSPEGFACPWVCYWNCHSYCPKECCSNPLHCPLQCKEFCSPYCKDGCCAPGARRLPKLSLNFQTAAETGKKEEVRPKVNESTIVNAQTENNNIAKQMEALKQATITAAKALGIPKGCPLFCPQVCTPGLCKEECCSRSAPAKEPAAQPTPALPQSSGPALAPAAAPAVAPVVAQVPPPAGSPAASVQQAPLQASTSQIVGQATNTGAEPVVVPVMSEIKLPDLASLHAQVASQKAKGLAPQAVIQQEESKEGPTFSVKQPNGKIQSYTIMNEPITVEELPPEGQSQTGQTAQNQSPLPSAPSALQPLSNQAPVPAPMESKSSSVQLKSEPSVPLPPVQATAPRPFTCATPINCPEGGVVDPDYCPPICRTACIEQCPNECCPNYGRPLVQPKH